MKRSTINRIVRQENADHILLFLTVIKPLEGCCYCDDEEFHRGRAFIEQYAAALRSDKEFTLGPTQCADVIRYLHSIQPMEGRTYLAHDEITCGYHHVLEFLEDQLREGGKEEQS